MSRRIYEMSDDIEGQVCLKLQETEFSLQPDESTVRDNQALLVVSVRFINEKKICEELLFCHSQEIFCQRENIFSTVKGYLNLKGILIEILFSVPQLEFQV